MYDPRQLDKGRKFNVKNCEFVVVLSGNEQETIMTRDEIAKLCPQALIEWYEGKLKFGKVKN
jgi:hypothetical protein